MEHVYWVVEGKLAGRPGPHKYAWDLGAIKAAGIGGVVSLDGQVDRAQLASSEIQHLPVNQPMILLEDEWRREQFVEVMALVLPFADRMHRDRKAVLVHCFHGLDRSGCVLACWLVARSGLEAEAAIAAVRQVNPDAMQAFGYEEAVATFARLYRADPAAFEGPP